MVYNVLYTAVYKIDKETGNWISKMKLFLSNPARIRKKWLDLGQDSAYGFVSWIFKWNFIA